MEIAGEQRDLPVYRRRDAETTQRDWTSKLPGEQWHSRAEAVVNLQLQNVGISQECWDLARMLRHNPPVRLILMTACHRLLPAKSKEEDDLHQYVKDPAAGDQGAVSTFQKLQLWKGAARRLRQMGGTLPGVTTLMTAFDKITDQTPTPKENPGKGKGKGDPEHAEKVAANKKGQQCIRFYRGNCTRGDDCQYGHILGTDGKPLKIAPELLARFDKFTAAKKGSKGKGSFSTQMLLLNALERADPKCYCLLDTGANALVLPKRDGMTGSEAQCTVPGGGVISGMVVQVVACGEEYHAVEIEGAAPLLPLSWLILLAGWKYVLRVDKGRMRVSVQSPEGIETELPQRSKMRYLDQDTFWAVLSDAWRQYAPTSGMTPVKLKESLLAQEASRECEPSGFYQIPGHESW